MPLSMIPPCQKWCEPPPPPPSTHPNSEALPSRTITSQVNCTGTNLSWQNPHYNFDNVGVALVGRKSQLRNQMSAWHHAVRDALWNTHLRSFDCPIAVEEERPSVETPT